MLLRCRYLLVPWCNRRLCRTYRRCIRCFHSSNWKCRILNYNGSWFFLRQFYIFVAVIKLIDSKAAVPTTYQHNIMGNKINARPAIHDLLLGEGFQCSCFDGTSSLQSPSGAERVTRSTWALVFNGCNGFLVSPVHGFGDVYPGWQSELGKFVYLINCILYKIKENSSNSVSTAR